MARINFEDNVEAQPQFQKLLRLVGGNWALALGHLVLFFRAAQKAYGHNTPMTREELEEQFPEVLESGWAVPVEGGFQARSADKHFDWYRQKVEAGKQGGRPRLVKNLPVAAANLAVHAANRSTDPVNPLVLAPSPAPVLAPVQKRERATAPLESGAIDRCKKAWAETRAHYGASEGILPTEELALGRAVQRWGGEAVELAIIGKRYETKDDRYDPAKNLSLSRILDPQEPARFERLHALGVQARNSKRAKEENARMLAELRQGVEA